MIEETLNMSYSIGFARQKIVPILGSEIPATHYLDISWNIGSVYLLTAEIYSSTGSAVGRLVGEGPGPQSFNIGHLHDGLYVLRLEFSDGSTHTHKFIKQ